MSVSNWDYFKTSIMGPQYKAPAAPGAYAFPTVALPDLVSMIFMRLRINSSGNGPFDFIAAHAIAPERVVIFLVLDGQPQMFEDGALFPSDTLITQLRLLIK